jgi:SAM-dependent methyltransferase
MTVPADYEWGSQTARRQLARHLEGDGIELGPGHMPFPTVIPGVTVRYLDAWDPDDNGDRFPEIGAEAKFVQPDTVCDFNAEGLAPIADASQDFVVASHVLEHLANPLRMLDEMHRVLRPGGIVLILLPDRHVTFDKDRPATALEHLLEEYERGITEVDDAHIEEFLHHTANHQGEGPPGYRADPDPDLDLQAMSVHEKGLALLWLRWDDITVPAQRREVIELHRQRSIHAHVWDIDEFFPLVSHAVRHLGHRWELVDGLLPDDPGGREDEFGLVLRRATTPEREPGAATRWPGAEDRARALEAGWKAWRGWRGAVNAEVRQLRATLAGSEKENVELRLRVAELERCVDELRRAAAEGIGVVHRLGQGREILPEEISNARAQPGGEALPELIELLLRYRNHPFEEGARRQLGKARRAVRRTSRPPAV